MLQVFFCVLIGAFSLGNAGPNLQSFSVARGAAYAVYRIIDQVRPDLGCLYTHSESVSIHGLRETL